jgi:outer membrane protein OmpA-like peptidoglycan-associated protein
VTERTPSRARPSPSSVKYLSANGLPAERLAATGLGAFQPLDPGDDEIAFGRGGSR